jgi:hypothetical protein
MTLDDTFRNFYTWADGNALWLLLAAVVLPAAGTVAALIGRGGTTDADGRFIANAVLALGIGAVLFELVAISIGVWVRGSSLLEANALLLLAPVICLVGCVLGIRTVFPLNELGSIRTLSDVSSFALASLLVLWLLSKFRGWGILFLGTLGQLLLFGLFAAFVLWRLYVRATRRAGSRS